LICSSDFRTQVEPVCGGESCGLSIGVVAESPGSSEVVDVVLEPFFDLLIVPLRFQYGNVLKTGQLPRLTAVAHIDNV
jgi:hypothetical protein